MDVYYEGDEIVPEPYWDFVTVAFEKDLLVPFPLEPGQSVDLGEGTPLIATVYIPDRAGDGSGLATCVIVKTLFSDYLEQARDMARRGFCPTTLRESEYFWDWDLWKEPGEPQGDPPN